MEQILQRVGFLVLNNVGVISIVILSSTTIIGTANSRLTVSPSKRHVLGKHTVVVFKFYIGFLPFVFGSRNRGSFSVLDNYLVQQPYKKLFVSLVNTSKGIKQFSLDKKDNKKPAKNFCLAGYVQCEYSIH